METSDQRETKVDPELLDSLASEEMLDLLVLKAFLDRRDILVHLEKMDSLDCQETKEARAMQDSLGPLDHRVFKVLRETQDHPENLECLVHLALRGKMANLAFLD